MTDDEIHALLSVPRRIACVGASTNPRRPSHDVSAFLTARGHDVRGINPVHVGEDFLGHPLVADLSAFPGPIEIVDIFRRSEHVPEIVDAALDLDPLPRVIWMQIGVVHEAAAERARAAGVAVVMDRCPKIEYRRLGLG
ncbi:hypothetical protein LX81_01403 [Palleronia aestuarii]|uniref:CoA-binding domain-containing protein n=1 Tax=Palleronia aestuarii TaxID=568105 RepID=A0A2W7NBZ2_9RHOB|nr:CoA-binding protein [Palleronia aestuarii]PZX17678.1 hypothetical protein LX81_01403 [Palleronia aestuarii]